MVEGRKVHSTSLGSARGAPDEATRGGHSKGGAPAPYRRGSKLTHYRSLDSIDRHARKGVCPVQGRQRSRCVGRHQWPGRDHASAVARLVEGYTVGWTTIDTY